VIARGEEEKESMRVVVAGGHGQVALLFGELASERHDVVGLVRNPNHIPDLEAVGMTAEVVDLEDVSAGGLADVIGGSDAFVFSAGAGPGSGAARKETVDYEAAVKSVEACQTAGVKRFVMVSAMGTDQPPEDDSVFAVYLRAKSRADAHLMESGLEWTVLRPGRLTDDAPTGRVRIARHVPRGRVPRADVAAVIDEILGSDATIGSIFELVGGDTPIAEAVAAATRRSA
jgi:uncharacterized protein YbjT (DUF2867 family)